MKTQNFELEINHKMVDVSEITKLVLVWLTSNFTKLKRGKKHRQEVTRIFPI